MLSAYGLTIEGIRKVLMIHSINIPVIENADDFRKFLKEVNVGQNAIAIIDDVLFHDHEEKHVFTIYHENLFLNVFFEQYKSINLTLVF